MDNGHKVYVKFDIDGRIIAVNSDAFLTDISGWVQIDEGSGDRYHHAQGNYFEGGLYSVDNIPRYKLVDGKAKLRSGAELEAQRSEREKEELPNIKAVKISESKTLLAEFLEQHPLYYTDGKRYSVTAEKQSLLTSALARYQIAAAAGQQPALKWNATGEECTGWSFEDLAALALAIAAYVEPLVAQQQALEVAINACKTAKEVKKIEISYEIAA